MKAAPILSSAAALLLLLTTTGCFRVSSDTRALRDAALEGGFARADEKIEVGVGFFTVHLARLATKYIDMPPEARTALDSLKKAECAIYDVHQRRESLTTILAEADHAMDRRGCDRLVGVIHEDQLVAVYVPRGMSSSHDIKASVLVLNKNQLVCATARADAQDLLELAMSKVREQIPSLAAAELPSR